MAESLDPDDNEPVREKEDAMDEHEHQTTPSGEREPVVEPAAADETFGWTASDDEATGGGEARAAADRMLAQLQSMIDTVAVQAGPVVRQIGAKAAELAAIAAERAGPLAHRAADATADASERLAEKTRTWAADLRTKTGDGAPAGDDGDAASSASAAIDGADDAVEEAARDEPAEGDRT
jgi:hypothetical protein